MGDPAAAAAEPPPLGGDRQRLAAVLAAPPRQFGLPARGPAGLARRVVGLGLAPPANRHLLPRDPVMGPGTGPEALAADIAGVLELRRRVERYDRPFADAALLQQLDPGTDALGIEKTVQVKIHVTLISAAPNVRQVPLRRAWAPDLAGP